MAGVDKSTSKMLGRARPRHAEYCELSAFIIQSGRSETALVNHSFDGDANFKLLNQTENILKK